MSSRSCVDDDDCPDTALVCVQHIPDSVEELDLSYCSNLWFEKRKKSSTSLTSAFSMSQGT
jgi:hypothetical protein